MRRAFGLVWRAARVEVAVTVILQFVGAAALAGVLLFGREVVATLSDAGGELTTRDVLPAVLGLGAAMVVSGVTQVAISESRTLVGELTGRRTQDEIVDIATSVDYAQFESQDFHDLLQRANTRASQSAFQLVFDVLNLINVLATSAAVLLVLATSVPQVLPALLLVAVPFGFAARISARLAFKVSYDLTTSDRLRAYLYRALTGKSSAKELRVFGLAQPLHHRWSDLYDDRISRTRRLARQRLLLNGAAALAAAALVAAVLLVLADAAVSGRISLANAAVAIVALQQLSVRIRTATQSTGSLRNSTLFLDDFDKFRKLRGPSVEPPSPAPLPPGELRVERVSFTYPGTDRPVLEDVSLAIAPGEIVALVGVSGCGKTTLSNLIAGLYTPTAGRITYGGVDIADLDVSEYRRSLAVVFQDFVRYEMTARENIAMSDQARLHDMKGVTTAAYRAGIAEVLEQLPLGYETLMSRSYEDGADLSVGQWQRVAVGRAFFRDAPLLILDEPSAALDALAEQLLFERLRALVADRSVLMISHRFSTVRLAHRIVVMSEGRIVESGSHEDLMAAEGLYAELFSMQAKGYLPVAD